MNKKKTGYYGINALVILATAALFIYTYLHVDQIFENRTAIHLIIILVTVVLVHLIKAARLYVVLYGSEWTLRDYIKIYCKVTPVSVVLPFKLGEFFRMYCYGTALKSMVRGIVIVILDRFMDTIALVTMLLLVLVFHGQLGNTVLYLLVIFLCFALMAYFAFPGVFRFWKRYLLRAKATENKLKLLRFLESLNLIYREIQNVTRGKGVILYFMSLIAWAVEIGSIALVALIDHTGALNQKLSEYLNSAMSGSPSLELKQFICISVVLLVLVYIIVKACELICGKKVKH